MILGLVEHDRGKLNELSLQMLTFGRRLAQQLGVLLEAVVVGADGAGLAGRLGASGVGVVHLARHDRLTDYAPEAWAKAVVDLIGATRPAAVLAAGTDRGNEVLAHVAALADLTFAANCTEVMSTGDVFEVTRARWGGSLLEEARVKGAAKLLSVNPHAVPAEEGTGATPEVREFAPALEDRHLRVRVTGRVEGAAGKISLADAKVVIGGGRGVGSPEGFKVLQELADQLGAAVGCSRAVTSLGWRPHSDQVGQTGTRIAPDIYIACGISGAIQHMVGCKSAKAVLAINKDPEATIVSLADYAVIGDLHQVVPAITDAVKKARR